MLSLSSANPKAVVTEVPTRHPGLQHAGPRTVRNERLPLPSHPSGVCCGGSPGGLPEKLPEGIVRETCSRKLPCGWYCVTAVLGEGQALLARCGP